MTFLFSKLLARGGVKVAMRHRLLPQLPANGRLSLSRFSIAAPKRARPIVLSAEAAASRRGGRMLARGMPVSFLYMIIYLAAVSQRYFRPAMTYFRLARARFRQMMRL